MIKTHDDVIQILEWHENVTIKNADQFRQEMDNFLKTSHNMLILNLADTNYINSAGLGIIAESVMKARRSQRELVVSDIQQSVKEIFSIVKFASFIKLFESENEAIEYFQEN